MTPRSVERLLEARSRDPAAGERRDSIRTGAAALSSQSRSSASELRCEQRLVRLDPLGVVDVKQPPDAHEAALCSCGPCRGRLQARRSPQLRPAAVRRRRCRRARARSRRGTSPRLTSPSAAQLVSTAPPVARDRVADAAQHDLLRDGLELKWQPAGRNGKPELRLALDVATRATEQRAEAPVEAELLAMVADEVEHRARPSRPPCAVRGRAAGGKSVGLSVGRSRSSVSTSARRRPR